MQTFLISQNNFIPHMVLFINIEVIYIYFFFFFLTYFYFKWAIWQQVNGNISSNTQHTTWNCISKTSALLLKTPFVWLWVIHMFRPNWPSSGVNIYNLKTKDIQHIKLHMAYIVMNTGSEECIHVMICKVVIYIYHNTEMCV